MDIEDKILEKIEKLCQKAEQLIDQNKLANAQKLLFEAYELVPELKEEWEESTYILVSLGDTYLWQDNFPKALDAYTDALKCLNADQNPYIYMRKGQCLAALGQTEEAIISLKKAYEIDQEIFEDEDPQYLKMVLAN